jgi:cell division control protein 6
MPLFTPTPDIFTDETVLRHNTYTPDKILGRDTELEQYQYALQPIINDAPPKHIIITGKPGTGKTAMTKYILDHLETDGETHNIDISSVYVNCNGDTNGTSSYTAAIEIINKLRTLQHGDNASEMPATGYPTKKVFNTLIDELNNIGGTTLIVLDEIHQLSDEKLLYHIPRAPTSTHLNTDTHVGLIGISNIPSLFDTLSTDVHDTLDPETIHLGPYAAPQLKEILSARAEHAFHDNALNDGVIPYCAAKVSGNSGNARRAITQLREAGEIARNQNDTTVTEDHINEAIKKLHTDQVKDAVRSLTIQQKFALLTVALKDSTNQHEDTPTKKLYEAYSRVLEKHLEHEPKSLNTFVNRLKDLQQQELISCEQVHAGGRQNRYTVSIDLVLLLEVFDDPSEHVDNVYCSTIIDNAIDSYVLERKDVEHLNVYNDLKNN